MILLDFFQKEVGLNTPRIRLALISSGLANAALLIIISVKPEQMADTWVRLELLLGYAVALLVYLFAQRFMLDQSTTAVEQALAAMRIRLFDKICRKPLDFIEQYVEIRHYTPLIKDSNLLAQATTQFILAIQNIIVLILAMAYLAVLSAPTFYVLLVIVVLIIPFYRKNFTRSRFFLSSSSQHEAGLLGYLQTLRNGFRQVKSDAAEAIGLTSGTQSTNRQSSQSRLSFNENMVNNIIFSNAVFYVFLLIVVFILPLFITGQDGLLYQIISVISFMLSPISTLVMVMPMLARATQNLHSLYRLEARLDAAPTQQIVQPTEPARFTTLRLEQVTYRYTEQQQTPLLAGPFDLALCQSEIVLITGENGSGKTTLLKLLSGLYQPYGGRLSLNDQIVQGDQASSQYTGLFSVVWSDFHLSDRQYGLTAAAAADIPFWLQQMQLDRIVSFADGRFSSVRLSAGLRQRLACVVALAQRRPICIFDEVMADQDPAFRRHFHHYILPLLKQRGYTVVLVAQDTAYQHCADRLVRLVRGRIVEDSKPAGAASAAQPLRGSADKQCGADQLVAEIHNYVVAALPTLRKTILRKLPIAVAGMVKARTINTQELILALPLTTERTDMRAQWLRRLLKSPLVDCIGILEPFARALLVEAAASGQTITLLMDQTDPGEYATILMVSVSVGSGALPLVWQVQSGSAEIGWEIQKNLLVQVQQWLPEGAVVRLLADRFYPSAALFVWLQAQSWGYRLRLPGHLPVQVTDPTIAEVGDLAVGQDARFEQDATLFRGQVVVSIGVVQDAGYPESRTVAMDCAPTREAVLEYSERWGIEPQFSDFRRRGFQLDKTQVRDSSRISRLVLIMALAMYWCRHTE